MIAFSGTNVTTGTIDNHAGDKCYLSSLLEDRILLFIECYGHNRHHTHTCSENNG
jgi:hypothetical protein